MTVSVSGYKPPNVERMTHYYAAFNTINVAPTLIGKACRLWDITALISGNAGALVIKFEDGVEPFTERYRFEVNQLDVATDMYARYDNARGLFFPNGIRITPGGLGPIVLTKHVINISAEILGNA